MPPGRYRAPAEAVLDGEVRVWAPANPFHPADGVGIRIHPDQAFVGRHDVGDSQDPVERSDRTIDEELTTGTCLAFDHRF